MQCKSTSLYALVRVSTNQALSLLIPVREDTHRGIEKERVYSQVDYILRQLDRETRLEVLLKLLLKLVMIMKKSRE